MKALIACAVLLLVGPELAAQTAPEAAPGSQSRAQGYTFVGLTSSVGDATNLIALGGGGEGFIYKGLAAGGEVGYLFTGERFAYGLGMASANVSYHFRELDPNGRWIPFVTGGYTLAFRGDTGNLANYGGGVTYWFRPRWGARIEVRNLQYAHGSTVMFRFGLSFR